MASSSKAKTKSKARTASRRRAAKEEDPPAPVTHRFRLGGQEYEICATELTLDEEKILERAFDQPFPLIAASGWLENSSEAMSLLAYIAAVRENPEMTQAEAGAIVRSDIQIEQDGEVLLEGRGFEPRPTQISGDSGPLNGPSDSESSPAQSGS